LERFEVLVARKLAEFGARRGRTFKFMRRAIRMPLAELAAQLSVYPITIRKWEDEEADVEDDAFAVLRELVLARTGGEHGHPSVLPTAVRIQGGQRVTA